MSDFASALTTAMATQPTHTTQAAPAAATPAAPELTTAPEAKAEPKAEAEPPKGMTAAEKKIWKLKIDGQEIDFDASDEEVVKREVMKARAANKRFEEAAQMRKQAEQFIEKLRADPFSVLTDPRLGVDARALAEKFVWEQLQEAQLTPEQRQKRTLEAELKKYREAEATQQQQRQAQEMQQLENQYAASYEKTIQTALEQGGVPKTKETVRRMAYYLKQAIQHDLDLQPADLIAQVRRDYLEEHKALYSTADGDALLALVGEDLAAKIRASDIKRLKSTQPDAYRKQPDSAQARPSEKMPRKLPAEEWREELHRKLLGK